LTFDLAKVVKEGFEGSSSDFERLVAETLTSLERQGSLGNVTVSRRLAQIEASGEAVVCGDLHGDLESLIDILEKSKIVSRLGKSKNNYVIFLGDYGDRGALSVEVFWVVLSLKTSFPDQVILLRGNHEGPEYILPVPYDLPVQFRKRFEKDWEQPYRQLRSVFESLLNALIVRRRYLMIHGGPPSSACRIENLAFAGETSKKRTVLEEILWNDPNEETDETVSSPRGAGMLFGRKVAERCLDNLRVKIIVRGHESCDEGFKISHDGKILTLFSRKGSPYFNSKGAYLDVPLDFNPEDAGQLVPYIHTF
jgi:protein phosphatase